MDKEIIFKNRKDYEQRSGDYTGEIECHEEKMKEFYKKEFIKYEKIFSELDCHLEYSFSEWKSKKWQYLHVSDVFCEVYYKGKLVYLDGEGAAGVHLCWIWRIYIYERELFRRKVILCDERKEFGDDMQDMYDTMVQYIKEEQK